MSYIQSYIQQVMEIKIQFISIPTSKINVKMYKIICGSYTVQYTMQ